MVGSRRVVPNDTLGYAAGAAANDTARERPTLYLYYATVDNAWAMYYGGDMKAYPFADVEAKWQEYWREHETFRVTEDAAVPKEKRRYVLDMFPYPSAAGLHVGHPLGYTATDIYCRYLRMNGYAVLHPMGFDSFGLPAENYAIQTGTHPRVSTEQNIRRFRAQIKSLGYSYDWSREVSTHEPRYFRWTQWIFLQLYKRGLAYMAEVPVWYCAALGTVLANEEVLSTEEGARSERGNHPVERKMLRQWMLKITAYAERLLDDLALLDWPESIKSMQRNWIGKSVGVKVRFAVVGHAGCAIEVFTTRVDTLCGATFMALSPEHPLLRKIVGAAQRASVADYVQRSAQKSELERTDLEKDKSGVFSGCYAVNPANGREIPIWVADYVLMSYGSGAVMAVPAHDTRDYAFALKYDLEIVSVYEVRQRAATATMAKSATTTKSAAAHDAQGVPSHNAQGVPSHNAQGATTAKSTTAGITHSAAAHSTPPADSATAHGATTKIAAADSATTTDATTHATNAPHDDAAGTPAHSATTTKSAAAHGAHATQTTNAPDDGAQAATHATHDGAAAINSAPADTTQSAQGATTTKSAAAHSTPPADSATAHGAHATNAPQGATGSTTAHSAHGAQGATKSTAAHDAAGTPPNTTPAEHDTYVVPLFPYTGTEGRVINSGQFNGSTCTECARALTQWLIDKGQGEESVQYKMRDWIFSRQRYWGEPIPVVHHPDGHIVPMDEADLPLTLPQIASYQPSGSGESPLASIEEWMNTEYPPGSGKQARRESNTMPQWAGSCWYHLRYLDPHNEERLADKEKIDYWMPVDLYVGGAEHAVLHLLYARFWHKVFYDIGLVHSKEPFMRLVNQGIVLGEDGTKMSKSLGNVVNPDDIIREYGADSLRLYEMFMGPLEMSKPWKSTGVVGMFRFLNRVWRLTEKRMVQDAPPAALNKVRHYTIKKVTEDAARLSFNTAIAQLMVCVNHCYKEQYLYQSVWEDFIKLLSIFAPHIAEELWQRLGGTPSVSHQQWPTWDRAHITDDVIIIAIQVNGKTRATMQIAADSTKAETITAAQAEKNITRQLAGKRVVRTIFVPSRLVNFVVA